MDFFFFLDQLSETGSFLTAHLTLSQAAPVCRRTVVEKHCSKPHVCRTDIFAVQTISFWPLWLYLQIIERVSGPLMGLTPDLHTSATGLKHHTHFYEEWREKRVRFLLQPSDTTSCWRLSARSCTFTLFTHGGPRITCVRMHFKERRRDDAELQLLIKITKSDVSMHPAGQLPDFKSTSVISLFLLLSL